MSLMGFHRVRGRRKPKWEKAFLSTLRNTCNVRASCQSANVTRATVYEYRHSCPEFAALWQEAEEDAADVLEARAWGRSEISDSILMFLLKAHRPDKYREKVRIDMNVLRSKAQKIADQLGLDVNDVLAEAEKVAKSIRA